MVNYTILAVNKREGSSMSILKSYGAGWEAKPPKVTEEPTKKVTLVFSVEYPVRLRKRLDRHRRRSTQWFP